ncbi:MAG: hypothetical protein IPF54_04360 [Draconibacterium sp.]|nr:hypothetical protein [Draconibacterium sp.]
MDAGTELTNTVSVVSDQVPGPTLASALTPLSASASLTVDKVGQGGPDPVTAARRSLIIQLLFKTQGTDNHRGGSFRSVA